MPISVVIGGQAIAKVSSTGDTAGDQESVAKKQDWRIAALARCNDRSSGVALGVAVIQHVASRKASVRV
ncbi:hypothetical protein CUR86_11745 [Salinicola acroporae]|uniref:Uncharacterized protein n=1 Tax=Salinicola acroporae TaxID=1541440 RepID=A0ABT6I5T1_9GAMM|nr:hypothetical protein [Salinicola acroporae]